jgi:hypothetical protein
MGVRVIRHRHLLTIIVAIIVATLAACSGGSTSSQPPGDGNSPAPAPTSAAPADSGELRLGCGTYCKTAGGYGAPGATGTEVIPVEVVGGAVSVDADGYVPVTLTCTIPATCKGVVVIGIKGFTPTDSSKDSGYGRSDLRVDANSTQTIGIPLSPDELAYARAHSPVTVVVGGDSGMTDSCEDIPQLAPTCTQITLDTFIKGAELQLTAT